MTTPEERLRRALSTMADEMPAITRAPEAVRRQALRRVRFTTWSTRSGAVLAAGAVTLLLVWGLATTFRPADVPDERPGGTASVPTATVEVTADQGVLVATLTFGDVSRSGTPVEAIRGGVETRRGLDGPIVTPSASDPITELLGTSGFSLDNDVVTEADPESITLPHDASIETNGLDRTVYFFFPHDGIVFTGDDRDFKRTVETLTDPAELRELEEARYRLIVAGMTGDGTVSQFMFDVEVVSSERSGG